MKAELEKWRPDPEYPVPVSTNPDLEVKNDEGDFCGCPPAGTYGWLGYLEFDVSGHPLTVILIGKDGGEKARQVGRFDLQTLFDRIRRHAHAPERDEAAVQGRLIPVSSWKRRAGAWIEPRGTKRVLQHAVLFRPRSA